MLAITENACSALKKVLSSDESKGRHLVIYFAGHG
jgi:hypothetical protein